MNAGFTLIPIIFIRYGLMAIVNKAALKRAALFAPLIGKERAAYWIYQITGLAIMIYLFFLTVKADGFWFYAGLCVYIAGTALYSISVIDFTKPQTGEINTKGLYRISRNPMYIAYFIYFLGCAMMVRSVILICILLVFQVSAHFIILSEERWCIGKFGEEYKDYMSRVRRYL